MKRTLAKVISVVLDPVILIPLMLGVVVWYMYVLHDVSLWCCLARPMKKGGWPHQKRGWPHRKRGWPHQKRGWPHRNGGGPIEMGMAP